MGESSASRRKVGQIPTGEMPRRLLTGQMLTGQIITIKVKKWTNAQQEKILN
jgi:hypothetical protein